MPTYYEILGVEPTANDEQLKAAWKAKQKEYHPDNQETGDEKLAKQINEAYDTLSDPDKRAAYDRGAGLTGASGKDSKNDKTTIKDLEQRSKDLEAELNTVREEMQKAATENNAAVEELEKVRQLHLPYLTKFQEVKTRYDEAQNAIEAARKKMTDRSISADARIAASDEYWDAVYNQKPVVREISQFNVTQMNFAVAQITAFKQKVTDIRAVYDEKKARVEEITVERRKIDAIIREEKRAKEQRNRETLAEPAERFASYPLPVNMPYKWGNVADINLTKVWNHCVLSYQMEVAKKRLITPWSVTAGLIAYDHLPDTMPFIYKAGISAAVMVSNSTIGRRISPVTMTAGEVAGITAGKAVFAAWPKLFDTESQRMLTHGASAAAKAAFAVATYFAVAVEGKNLGEDIVSRHLMGATPQAEAKSVTYRTGEYLVDKAMDAVRPS